MAGLRPAMLRLFFLILTLVAGPACTHAAAAYSPRDSGRAQASWWIKNHGVVTATDDPLVARATEVFEQVRAAADKRGNRLPRLIVVRGGGDPYAAAIQDGSIVLTHDGVKLCYQARSREQGDARLAFLLGHELAHLAEDDFWHVAAFAAVEAHTDDPPTRETLLDLVSTGSEAQADVNAAAEAAKLKELQADSYGLLYTMMAGYDAGTVLDTGGGFLQEWVSQSTARAAYGDPTHPRPGERLAFLRAQLGAVLGNLDFFRFGARLYQLGRYEDSILFLERFAESFPSREVYNDLGLAHYQLAFRALHRCDPALATRFRLSTELDRTTLAERAGSRDAGRDAGSCDEHPAFRNHALSALRYLEHAAEHDAGYVPARLNLASAHVAAGEYSKALGVLDEIEAMAPAHPGAVNNRAVALYLFGRESGIDTMDQATGMLRELVPAAGPSPDALYNLGRLESERGRNAAARENWVRFLEMEPAGPWSTAVRGRLGLGRGGEREAQRGAETKTQRTGAATSESPRPAVSLGAVSDKTRQLLAAMDEHPFRLGVFEGAIYTGAGSRVLVIEGFVELVESPAASDLEPPAQIYGPPRRSVPYSRGETLVYGSFAIDVEDGSARNVVHFEGGGR